MAAPRPPACEGGLGIRPCPFRPAPGSSHARPARTNHATHTRGAAGATRRTHTVEQAKNAALDFSLHLDLDPSKNATAPRTLQVIVSDEEIPRSPKPRNHQAGQGFLETLEND